MAEAVVAAVDTVARVLAMVVEATAVLVLVLVRVQIAIVTVEIMEEVCVS